MTAPKWTPEQFETLEKELEEKIQSASSRGKPDLLRFYQSELEKLREENAPQK